MQLIKNKVFALTLSAALLGVAAVASAQTTDQQPLGLSARIGAFFPTDSTTQSESKTWLAAGLQYKLTNLSVGAAGTNYRSSLELSFDYTSRGDYQSLPLLLNYVGHVGDGVFYTGGLGVSFTRVPEVGGVTSKARFAYTLGLGYDFPTTGSLPVFVEGRFFGNERSELNGFAAYVGVRF